MAAGVSSEGFYRRVPSETGGCRASCSHADKGMLTQVHQAMTPSHDSFVYVRQAPPASTGESRDERRDSEK